MIRSSLSRRAFVVASSAVGAALVVPAFADAPDAVDTTIEGNVMYRERMMLPQGSRVEVKLVDVSRADAPSVTIASTEIKDAPASPIPYKLTYDPKLIDARGRFALQATIFHGDQMLFTTTTHHPALGPALGNDETSTDIMVQRVAASPEVAELTLYGPWLAEDIDGGGVIDRAQTTLVIAQDGAVHGSGGCNRYSGSAKIDGDKLVFGALASTNMACAEAQMNQEGKFHAALGKVASFRIDQQQRKLSLLDADGKTLVLLASNPQ